MIYDARDGKPPQGYGRVYDADTGEDLGRVYRYDDETGDYWRYVTDDKGRVQVDGLDQPMTEHGRCRLKFVPFDENGHAPFVPDRLAEKKIRFREFL